MTTRGIARVMAFVKDQPLGLKDSLERFKMVWRIPVVVIPGLTASQDFLGHALRVFQICDLVFNKKGLGNFTSNL